MQAIVRGFILWYIRYWARKALCKHHPKIIGIAGSVGKTSTRQAIQAILQDHFPTKVISGNSETGIPLGLLGLEVKSLGFSTPVKSLVNWLTLLLSVPFATDFLKGSEYIIVEMGIDEPDPPKNMEYLLTILRPDIAIELNIAPPHLGQFEKLLVGKNVENKLDFLLDRMAEEDIKIITKSHCKVGIYNADDARVNRLISSFASQPSKTQLLAFGKGEKNAITYGEYLISIEQTKFAFFINLSDKKGRIDLHLSNILLPQEYQETLAAGILASLQTGLSLDAVGTSLGKNFILPKGRASLFQGVKNSTIIDSSYNASPKAVSTFLNMLQTLKKQSKRPIVFVFGDMRELGNEAQEEHEKIAKEIAGVVDYLYCVGPLTREYVIQEVEQYNKNLKEIRWFDSSKRAGEYLKEHLPKDAIVLVKGSQNTIYLEEAVKFILKDKENEKHLCRQEAYWLEKKKLE